LTFFAFIKGQSRQQVQQFAGLLAIKSTFQDQISTAIKPKVSISDSIKLYLFDKYYIPG
jgi:hypothetical protein